MLQLRKYKIKSVIDYWGKPQKSKTIWLEEQIGSTLFKHQRLQNYNEAGYFVDFQLTWMQNFKFLKWKRKADEKALQLSKRRMFWFHLTWNISIFNYDNHQFYLHQFDFSQIMIDMWKCLSKFNFSLAEKITFSIFLLEATKLTKEISSFYAYFWKRVKQ